MGYYLTNLTPPACEHTPAFSCVRPTLLRSAISSGPETHIRVFQLQERGLRYCNPETGRWMNRDPIGEKGRSASLYGAFRNNAVNNRDYLGLIVSECTVRTVRNIVAGTSLAPFGIVNGPFTAYCPLALAHGSATMPGGMSQIRMQTACSITVVYTQTEPETMVMNSALDITFGQHEAKHIAQFKKRFKDTADDWAPWENFTSCKPRCISAISNMLDDILQKHESIWERGRWQTELDDYNEYSSQLDRDETQRIIQNAEQDRQNAEYNLRISKWHVNSECGAGTVTY